MKYPAFAKAIKEMTGGKVVKNIEFGCTRVFAEVDGEVHSFTRSHLHDFIIAS